VGREVYLWIQAMLAGFKDGEKNIKALKSGKLLELNMVNWFHNVSEKQLL
jgi:hypothetical protein